MKRERLEISEIEKKRILSIQGEGCLYCGRKPGQRYRVRGSTKVYLLKRHWDHIIPWVYSRKTINNITASCNICNASKYDKIFDTMYDLIKYLDKQIKKRGIIFLDDTPAKSLFKSKRFCPVCNVMFRVKYKHRNKRFCSAECFIKSRSQDYLDTKETEQIIRERKELYEKNKMSTIRDKVKKLNNLTGAELLKNIEEFIRTVDEKQEKIRRQKEERRFTLRRKMAKKKYFEVRNLGILEGALYDGLNTQELGQKYNLNRNTVSCILNFMDFRGYM